MTCDPNIGAEAAEIAVTYCQLPAEERAIVLRMVRTCQRAAAENGTLRRGCRKAVPQGGNVVAFPRPSA